MADQITAGSEASQELPTQYEQLKELGENLIVDTGLREKREWAKILKI